MILQGEQDENMKGERFTDENMTGIRVLQHIRQKRQLGQQSNRSHITLSTSNLLDRTHQSSPEDKGTRHNQQVKYLMARAIDVETSKIFLRKLKTALV